MKAKIGEYKDDGRGFIFPLKQLVKHFVALGGSGSGKTVLSKVIIEEAILNKIPSILIDPQGDLASLALKENEKFKNTKVKIYTPTSSKGIPLCINPLKLPKKGIEYEDLVSILNQISNSITSLIGYDIGKDKGKHAQAILYYTLLYLYDNNIKVNDFNDLINILSSPSEELTEHSKGFFDNKKELQGLIKKLKYLTFGEKELMFNFGQPLDIEELIGKKTPQISVIYLNSLSTKKDKEFFVSMLALQLYEWMLKKPSKTLQLLFYIDEIANYIPAGSLKPITKDILKLIYKQARKYGVGCMVSTQNPGDIDYKAFSQFSTWAIGRLTTKQDRQKIKLAMKSLAGDKINDLVLKMPKLKPGEFLFFSPDVSNEVSEIKCRWLYTKHETLTESQIKDLMKDYSKKYEIKSKATSINRKSNISKQKHSLNHFKVLIKDDALTKLIQKHHKKKFFLFGKNKESLSSSELLLKPFYKLKTRIQKKTLFGKKYYEDKEVFVDAIDGEFTLFINNNYRIYKGLKQMLSLSESEIKVLKQLIYNNNIKSKTISEKLKLTESFINKTLNTLMKKKIAKYNGKDKKAYLWSTDLRPSFDSSLNKVVSTTYQLGDEDVEGKILKHTIKLKDIKDFMKAWFNAEIISSEIIYYPAYELVYSANGKDRVLFLSAVDGSDM